MEGLVVFVLGFGLLHAATYVWHERRHRQAWVHDVPYVRCEPDLDSGFRGDGGRQNQPYVGPERNPRAPWSVRATAMWSIGMGQMLVPGAAVALLGTIVYGIGLVGIPGCILAARIWAVGPALLRAEPTSIERARSAARFARALNAVALLIAAGLLAIPDALGLAVGTAVYAGISIAHAQALDRATERVEQLWIERGYPRHALTTLRPPPRADARVGA